MLKECYSEIKEWLKIERSAPLWRGKSFRHLLPLHRPSVCDIALEITLTVLLSLTCPLELLAQPHPPDEASQLPRDFEDELTAGAAGRSRLGSVRIAPDDSYPVACEVWRDLLQDSELARLQLPFPWQLALVNDRSANAFSLPDGQVIVDRSLANLLGRSRGLWAALLSHEIAHVSHRHWLRRTSFLSKLEQRLENSALAPIGTDSRWQMASLDAHMDAPDALARFVRELEFEADSEGMMLMARTGFHPGFELAIHHLLQANLGDRSGFEAIFSTHPRWITRDRNSRKAYDIALAEFVRRWPSAASSPGGLPPTIVFLGKPKSQTGPAARLRIAFSLRCANPGQPLRSVLRLYQAAGKTSTQREEIEYWEPTTCTDHNEKKTLNITLPDSQHPDHDWQGEVLILNSEDVALQRSRSFTIYSATKEKPTSNLGAMAYRDSGTTF
jgi:hypothetical protein